MIPPCIMVIIIFIFGLCIGSFLNVCIYRIPNEKSIVSPPSSCLCCGTVIRWYDNVPVLSFILLGGKCRSCSAKISYQYPFIELLFALMAVHVYMGYAVTRSNPIIEATYYSLLCACLLTASIIDLKYYILPDEIIIAGILIGCGGAFFFPYLVNQNTMFTGLLHSLYGIAVGYGALRCVVWFGSIVFRKEAMGLGDPKFLAMIGSFLGFKNVLLVIFISSLLGAVIGGMIVFLFRKNKSDTVIPYGPFLSLAAYLTFFYGNSLVQWYWDLILR